MAFNLHVVVGNELVMVENKKIVMVCPEMGIP